MLPFLRKRNEKIEVTLQHLLIGAPRLLNDIILKDSALQRYHHVLPRKMRLDLAQKKSKGVPVTNVDVK